MLPYPVKRLVHKPFFGDIHPKYFLGQSCFNVVDKSVDVMLAQLNVMHFVLMISHCETLYLNFCVEIIVNRKLCF